MFPQDFKILWMIYLTIFWFSITYIDDILIFFKPLINIISTSITYFNQHYKHINVFLNTIKKVGLVVSAKKIELFVHKSRCHGHHIHKGTIIPIDRPIIFCWQILHGMTNTDMLKNFLKLKLYCRLLQKSGKHCTILYDRIKKKPPALTQLTPKISKNKA